MFGFKSKEIKMIKNLASQSLYMFWDAFFQMRLISSIGIKNLPDTIDTVLLKQTAVNTGSAAVGRYGEFVIGGRYSTSGKTDINGYPSKYIYINSLNTFGSRFKCREFAILYDNVLKTPLSRFVSAFAYSCYAAHTAAITNIQQQQRPYIVATSPETKLTTDNIMSQMYNAEPYINVQIKKGQSMQDIKNLISTFDIKVEYLGDKFMSYIKDQVELFDMITGIAQPNDKRERMISLEASMGAMSNMVSMNTRIEMYQKFADRCNKLGFNNGKDVEVFAVTAGVIPGVMEFERDYGKSGEEDVVDEV